MDEIRLERFRCFNERQVARLAPLTLLVGENGTGKTSFLAVIRALEDSVGGLLLPDFREAPYDLGSFDEIAHRRGARGGRAQTFRAGSSRASRGGSAFHFDVAFGRRGNAPAAVSRRFATGDAWIEEHFEAGRPHRITIGTSRGTWETEPSDQTGRGVDGAFWPPVVHLLRTSAGDDAEGPFAPFTPQGGSPALSAEDEKVITEIAFEVSAGLERRSFASAPVRSKPHRTHDPARATLDPEGDDVPTYLADLYSRDRRAWAALEARLNGFGRAAGLFDEIRIRELGRRDGDPFRVQVRKSGGSSKGPWRNLIDAGYGVSQALSVVTALLRPDAPPAFLLQQPDVHLHPSAQAALGSLFCQVAGPKRRLVVETHSDHLIDRVRMDVRDGASMLRPQDVSILFFERGDLDVRIHSLGIDGEGNVTGAPNSYRSFFMEEIERSLWKRPRVGVA